MEIVGKITFVKGKEEIKENFFKSTIVVEELGKEYPNSLLIDFVGKNADKPADKKVGDIIKVAFNCNAREYNGRYFNSINGRLIKEVKAEEAEASKKEEEFPF